MAEKAERRKGLGASRLASVVLLAFLTTAYLVRSDGLYAATIWPPIVWTGLGLGLCLPGISRRRSWGLMALWLVFLAVFGEELSGLWHSVKGAGVEPNLTVVSLNCNGGSDEAGQEAASYNADITLLQERPTKKSPEMVAGPDAAILVKGKLEPIELPKGTGDFVAAKATLDNGLKLTLVSLRLLPPIFRLDYYLPSCWQDYAENRRLRRGQLQRIAAWIAENAPDGPLLVAGDFNTSPDPGITAPLTPRLRDAYKEAGTFWGYTAVNDFPLARIDQIWVSKEFQVVDVTAFKTKTSDHRLVRAKLALMVDR